MPLTTGKMRPEHEKRIKKNFKRLKNDMDAKDLTDRFIQEEVFDFPDVERINGYNPNTQDSRNNCFFLLLFQSGPRAYEIFLKALRENGQEFLADMVMNTELTGDNQNTDAPMVWLNRIAPSTRTRRLVEKDLSKLAQCLGLDWALVLTEMGLSQADIDHCIMEHPHSPTMQIYSALNKWRVRQTGLATLDNFVRICLECPATTVDWAQMERIANVL